MYKKIMVIISVISMILLVFREDNYLVVIALTLNVVAFALYAGEIKQKTKNIISILNYIETSAYMKFFYRQCKALYFIQNNYFTDNRQKMLKMQDVTIAINPEK